MNDFVTRQRAAQAAHFARNVAPDQLRADSPYRLRSEHRHFNLAPSIRVAAEHYFQKHGIAWHLHASHGLSSQVCCLNFLMPLATQPDQLAVVIGNALGIAPPEMLPMEEGPKPNEHNWYVGFEWTGRRDYLNEWPKGGMATRGANATSADAAVRFVHQDRVHTLLIEWKYTESYSTPTDTGGNATRLDRYREIAFAPNGPLRADLGLKVEDFFWEPFYQLLRQQMLAFRMQAAGEDEAERVAVLHIAPAGNAALRRITAPRFKQGFGDTPFTIFRALLTDPNNFTSRTTEEVFATAIANPRPSTAAREWAEYLRGRYTFVTPPA